MNIIKIFITVSILILSVYIIQILFVHFFSVDISEYRGDGVIEKEGSGLLARGFKINFPEFDMTKKYEASYEIVSLPSINKNYVFMIEIIGENYEDNYKCNFNDYVSLVVFNKSVEIVKFKSSLCDAIETKGANNKTLYYFWGNEASSIVPFDLIKEVPIKCYFKFEPDEVSKNNNEIMGRLVMIVGGSI